MLTTLEWVALGVTAGVIVFTCWQLWILHRLIQQALAVLGVARSDRPIETARGMEILTASSLFNIPPVEDAKPALPPPSRSSVLIDGQEFEFPPDSPLNKFK